jgi:hypothetical protein
MEGGGKVSEMISLREGGGSELRDHTSSSILFVTLSFVKSWGGGAGGNQHLFAGIKTQFFQREAVT